MAEQRITTKPTVNALLDEDYIFINHDGALRQVRKDDADLASAAGLAAEATARAQFEENLTEANEEFVETVDERMNTAESIVYSAFPIGTASGSVASFNDGADNIPMKSLKVAIVPKQSGSGDPSPDNVRPITGWTDVDVNVVGSNIFDGVWERGLINGTTGQNVANSSTIRSKNYIPVKGGSKICGAFKDLPNNFVYLYEYKADKTYNLTSYETLRSGSITLKEDTAFIRIRADDLITNIGENPLYMLQYGEAHSAYEPYTGHTTPVPLGQTVYGGTVDPISGELKITHGFYTYNNISTTSGTAVTGGWRCDFNCPSDDINRGKWSVVSQPVLSMFNQKVMNEGGVSKGYAANSYTVIVPNATSKAEADTALNGLQIAYTLATPTTVQLTPAQVASLLGTNNVWADCGAVEVEYRADPTLAYNELQALILENI